MNNPKLTVAIPTYDRRHFLRTVLTSLQNQSWQEFVVILFDNASPYDIGALAAEFPSLNISIDKNETNVGNQANFAKVMNYPFATPYVMIFHDDDAIHPEYLKEAVAWLEKDQSIGWVGSLIKYTYADKKMLEFSPAPAAVPCRVLNKKEMVAEFMRNLPIGFSSVVYRAEGSRQARPEVERFHKWLDRPYMLDAAGDKRMAVLMYPYINYRLHGAQDSAQTYRDHLTQMVNLVDHFANIKDRDREALVFAAASALRTAAMNADSLADFRRIVGLFKERGLFSWNNVRPYGVAWAMYLLAKRLRYLLLKR